MTFSERNGKREVRTELQIGGIDTRLANQLWNTFLNNFGKLRAQNYIGEKPERQLLLEFLWTDFFGNRIDKLPRNLNGKISSQDFLNYCGRWFFKATWHEKYDFIEKVLEISPETFKSDFNRCLEKEFAGYRIVENKIIPITSKEEISSIEEAVYQSESQPVKNHLETSLSYISNRDTSNYRNSIKESISAIESYCNSITGASSLGKALTILEKNYNLHGALKKAFSNLYGYTSDTGGIRHALQEEDIEITMEDAIFMLVSCSAFINYLKSKMR